MVKNLTFVNGASSAITNTIQGTSDRNSTIDLRGLGPRSTLTLLDGKRLANQNVNTQIPTIAIQRLDIVADGAAALYGNEAVAGVVNFVPYKSYRWPDASKRMPKATSAEITTSTLFKCCGAVISVI